VLENHNVISWLCHNLSNVFLNVLVLSAEPILADYSRQSSKLIYANHIIIIIIIIIIFFTPGSKDIIIIINDSIYPAVSKASRTGNN